MRGALEGPLQGGDQAGVLVGDHEFDSAQAAFLQAGQEGPPEHLVLAVADVEAEDLPVAVGADTASHHHGHGDHLGGGVAHVQVGGVQVDVGEGDVVQAAGSERGDHLVQAGADPGDLGPGDPRVDPQRGDQVVDGAGGDPTHV